jgi:hypothetical protein
MGRATYRCVKNPDISTTDDVIAVSNLNVESVVKEKKEESEKGISITHATQIEYHIA